MVAKYGIFKENHDNRYVHTEYVHIFSNKKLFIIKQIFFEH